jgi:hypothetical protein
MYNFTPSSIFLIRAYYDGTNNEDYIIIQQNLKRI